MKGFEKYSNIWINHAKKLLEDLESENDPEQKEAFGAALLGFDSGKKIKSSQSDVFVQKLHSGFSEITISYYCLKDIETYIGRFPYSNSKISKVRYLAYHMENYLNEIYILKERLNAYLTTVCRLYRKDKISTLAENRIKPLYSIIHDYLSVIVDTRSAHVHQKRFSDPELERLESQAFLIFHSQGDFGMIENLFKIHYGIKRKKYKKTIKNNNVIIKDLLDSVFEILHGVVVDKAGQIKIPQNIKV